MKEPLDSYKSLQQFFTRRLVEGARPFVADGVASPVDGVVMSFHKVHHQNDHVDQVKDISYSLSGFIGETIPRGHNPDGSKKDLYHCIIYLAPGDYHGIHSPVDWSIDVSVLKFFKKKHFW
jgi:phosphatidylserine decarboxylase